MAWRGTSDERQRQEPSPLDGVAEIAGHCFDELPIIVGHEMARAGNRPGQPGSGTVNDRLSGRRAGSTVRDRRTKGTTCRAFRFCFASF